MFCSDLLPCFPRHAFYIRISKKHIKRLRRISNQAQQFGFLRSVNPYIFEEMILTQLKTCGYAIKRNKRYVNDGGIDGQVIIDGRKVLIQAKRYKGYVKRSDIHAFSDLCKTANCLGLFVHTGKTGKLVYRTVPTHIDIVSGERLLTFFNEKSTSHTSFFRHNP